jgi:hypothetical protein
MTACDASGDRLSTHIMEFNETTDDKHTEQTPHDADILCIEKLQTLRGDSYHPKLFEEE